MADATTTTATTGVPAKKEGAGFPPFKTETFPSQLFWLAITFGFLFIVLWRGGRARLHHAPPLQDGALPEPVVLARDHLWVPVHCAVAGRRTAHQRRHHLAA